MKWLLIALAFLMLTPAFAESFDPRLVSDAVMNFSESISVSSIQNYNTEYLDLLLMSYPRADYSFIQNMHTEPEAEFYKDDLTSYYKFVFKNLRTNAQVANLHAVIYNKLAFYKIKEKIIFPYVVPGEVKKYTRPTAKTESDNLAIKNIANQLAYGETDAYALVFKLANWVNTNVIYDEAYWDGLQSATQVLENRRGVCDEYTNLFIALARALGMPAKYVVGVVYANKIDDFQYHAWAEVWFPGHGWVPFDPTFAEYGWLDPTHIKLIDSADAEPPAMSYKWSSGKVNISDLEKKVEIISKKEGMPEYLKSKIWLEKNDVLPGSYNIVWLEMKNTDAYISTSAWLSQAPQVIDGNQKNIMLEPYELKKTGWILKIPDNIDTGYIYTYPVKANALFGGVSEANFTVHKNSKNYMQLEEAREKLEVVREKGAIQGKVMLRVNSYYPNKVYLQKPFVVSISFWNNGTSPIEKLETCVSDSCKQTFVGINEHKELNFTLVSHGIGWKNISITLAGEDINQAYTIPIEVKPKPAWMFILDKITGIFRQSKP